MKSKRAVSDLTLMMGIVIAIAILLIGGMATVIKLVEGEARASPRFVATDLVAIINTVQAAPEIAIFDFFTPQDENGYPIIGSLEIDDDARKLCVSKKTEDEIIGSIAESAGITAFGTGGQYAYETTRQKFRTFSQNKLIDKTLPSLKAKYGEGIPTTQTGKLIFASDNAAATGMKRLINSDFKVVDTPDMIRLSHARHRLLGTYDGIEIFDNGVETALYQHIVDEQGRKDVRLLAKYTGNPLMLKDEARKISRFAKFTDSQMDELVDDIDVLVRTDGIKAFDSRTELISGNALPAGVRTNLKDVVNDLHNVDIAVSIDPEANTLYKGATKIPKWKLWTRFKNWRSARSANVAKTAIGMEAGKFQRMKAYGGTIISGVTIIASVVAIGYVSGDWNEAIIQSAIPSILAFSRSFIETGAYKIFRALIRTKAAAGVAGAGDKVEDTAVCAAPPGADVVVGLGIRAAKATIIFADSLYTTALMDWWLIGIYNGASSAVSKEKAAIDCESFTSTKKVLLTPPNCAIDLEDGPAVKELGPSFKALEVQVGTLIATVTGLSIVCAMPGKVCCGARFPIYMGTVMPQLILIGANIYTNQDKYAKLVTSPSDIIPRTSCKPTPNLKTDTCDRTYLQQDCPNWYISDPGLGSVAAGAVLLELINAGPACAAFSWLGLVTPACNMGRYIGMTVLLVTFPGQLTGAMLQGYQVGFTKSKISAKPAPELGLTEAEFADNEGFWYAEMPFAIEFTKIYTDNTTSLDSRSGHFVIRKA